MNYTGPGTASPFLKKTGVIPITAFKALSITPYVLIDAVPGYFINVINMAFSYFVWPFGAPTDPFFIFASERTGDTGNALASFLPNDVYGAGFFIQMQTFGGTRNDNKLVNDPAFQNTGLGYPLTLEAYNDYGNNAGQPVEYIIYYTLETWSA